MCKARSYSGNASDCRSCQSNQVQFTIITEVEVNIAKYLLLKLTLKKIFFFLSKYHTKQFMSEINLVTRDFFIACFKVNRANQSVGAKSTIELCGIC